MRRIGVIGLGYVGLPVAVAFARRFPGTLGYDCDAARVRALAQGVDQNRTVSADALAASGLGLTHDPAALLPCDFYIVAVPTPIDASRRPDLEALSAATRTVASVLQKGDVVVFESTVYPGLTEEHCLPILEERSGWKAHDEFSLAYSPERINPGDPVHTFEGTVKVVGANDEKTRRLVAECYRAVVPAGVVEAPSIQVAEAAKVIENVQRDLNIALMNELAILFDRLGLETSQVLDVAATKWNFHRFEPGLVGGHCIGVDPYYLTARATAVGFRPEVILAGRRVNDGMGRFVAQKALKLVASSRAGGAAAGCAGPDPAKDRRAAQPATRVAVLGMTFKANVPDIRNSRVPDVVQELRELGAEVVCHDPLADEAAVAARFGIELVGLQGLTELDALVLATPHAVLVETTHGLLSGPGAPPVCVDVGGALEREQIPASIVYWRL